MRKYILDPKGRVVQVQDLIEWGNWYGGKDNRRLAKDVLDNGVEVSTVFLAMDHSFTYSGNNRPVLWELMIFGGEYDQYQERFRCRREARKRHKEVVERLRNELPLEE